MSFVSGVWDYKRAGKLTGDHRIADIKKYFKRNKTKYSCEGFQAWEGGGLTGEQENKEKNKSAFATLGIQPVEELSIWLHQRI